MKRHSSSDAIGSDTQIPRVSSPPEIAIEAIHFVMQTANGKKQRAGKADHPYCRRRAIRGSNLSACG